MQGSREVEATGATSETLASSDECHRDGTALGDTDSRACQEEPRHAGGTRGLVTGMGSLGGSTQKSSSSKALGQASPTVWMVSRAGGGRVGRA